MPVSWMNREEFYEGLSAGRAAFGRFALTAADPSLGVQWLAEWAPALTEVLNNLLGLLVADLNEFLAEVPMFPLDDGGGKGPAEVLPQALVGESVVVELQSAHQSVRIVDGPVAADDRVESDLV